MKLSDLVKNALLQKKRDIEQVNACCGKGGTKYVKLGDVRASVTAKAMDIESKKLIVNDNSTHHEDIKAMNEPESSASVLHINEELIDDNISNRDMEIIRQLRKRGEPILVFGETRSGRYERLQYVITHENVNEERGRNDFMAAVGKVNEREMIDYFKEKTLDPEQIANNKVKILTDIVSLKELTYSELTELDYKLDLTTWTKLITPIAQDKRNEYIDFSLKCIQYLLFCWEESILKAAGTQTVSNCNNHNISSNSGGGGGGSIADLKEKVIFEQTTGYLQPLFAMLEHRNINDDILPLLTLIMKFIKDQKYNSANDIYLKLAIGNAPWPIGVTMVGIHARTGREKISSHNVAHVLNDETQRKYIQAVKRLISFAEKTFPRSD